MLRQYQQWPSENMFFCGGRCITGPREDNMFRIIFAILVFIPSILFFGLESSRLWSISPPTVIVPAFLFVFLLVAWSLTSCTDPGILPRGDRENNKRNDMTMEVFERGNKVVYRWCYTCNIWRPPRTSHCSECNNCVLEFDHHCPVLGNCIGLRNIKFFLLTIIFGYALLITVIVDTVVFFVIDSNSQQAQTLGIAFVCILGAVLGIPLTAFIFFHLVMLLCSGKTTKEWVKNMATPERRAVCACEPSRIAPRKPLVVIRGHQSSGDSDLALDDINTDKGDDQAQLV